MTDVATLYVRNISPEVVARIKRRAEARGLTVGVYLEKLEALHGGLLSEGDDFTVMTPAAVAHVRLRAHDLGRVVD